ncbi:MAG: DNA-directed RNA polymerase subunit beta', partial [Firmicutes bacterium]|nr:DNA-directed RNA polymerase subunit beta' [Bacillota bacterium]
GKTDLAVGTILTDRELHEAQEKYGYNAFKAGMGAEAVKALLSKIDIKTEIAIQEAIVAKNAKGPKREKAIKKLDVLQSFRDSKAEPKWMILDVVPVIPPELRPMVQIDGGRFATSDANDLYRRVINRNNRLKKLMGLGAPEVIIRNEKRMLQEAVDALFDNGRRGKAVQGAKARDLKSLAGNLKGKQGRFRNNLLGKRVDYSGRTVIVVGPELKHYQAGIPKEMALELFKPFVMRKLVELNLAHHSRGAKRLIEQAKTEVWDVLEEVIKDHPVLLNRQPTLHRLSIQAFEPVLIDGRAMRLPPLVCPAFNADFDGDTMTVHVPLSEQAKAEARVLMLASNNILKLSDGSSIVTPTQDIVLGCYYLTLLKEDAKGTGGIYSDVNEAMRAYSAGKLDLKAPITIRRTASFNGKDVTGKIKTTLGRLLFNQCFPQDIGLNKRNTLELALSNEIEKEIVKKDLNNIIIATFKKHGATKAAEAIDKIKTAGFKYSTLASITISVFDMNIPAERATIIADAEKEVSGIEQEFGMGLRNIDEKVDANIEIWQNATNKLEKAVLANFDKYNPIKMMAASGARGSSKQIMQLAGMRGFTASISGRKLDVPTKGNYRLGLKPLEYFISAAGGRSGLADTALKTADAGYLTRKLADVAQDVIVVEDDCFASSKEKPKGYIVKDLDLEGYSEKLRDRIEGRFTTKEVVNPDTKKVIVSPNSLITEQLADEIIAAGIKEVEIRTVLTCRSKRGVCSKCYGRDMSSLNVVSIGEAVGMIAAQSIGEPGTQLTMRTKHAGGIATSNITSGLPRVEEIFEARKPKGDAIVSDVAGVVVAINNVEKRQEIVIKGQDNKEIPYLIPYGMRLKVLKGHIVEPGTPLTEGVINPHDLLRTRGLRSVQDYLMQEVIKVYKTQDVSINNKHLEIIIRQMLRKVRVEESGDTKLKPGDIVDVVTYEEENMIAMNEGKIPASAKRVLLAITKSALKSESFLSAASFQETSKMLTDAAIRGKVDNLTGLKENVIIGKLIPAGTGLKRYRNVGYKTNVSN